MVLKLAIVGASIQRKFTVSSSQSFKFSFIYLFVNISLRVQFLQRPFPPAHIYQFSQCRLSPRCYLVLIKLLLHLLKLFLCEQVRYAMLLMFLHSHLSRQPVPLFQERFHFLFYEWRIWCLWLPLGDACHVILLHGLLIVKRLVEIIERGLSVSLGFILFTLEGFVQYAQTLLLVKEFSYISYYLRRALQTAEEGNEAADLGFQLSIVLFHIVHLLKYFIRPNWLIHLLFLFLHHLLTELQFHLNYILCKRAIIQGYNALLYPITIFFVDKFLIRNAIGHLLAFLDLLGEVWLALIKLLQFTEILLLKALLVEGEVMREIGVDGFQLVQGCVGWFLLLEVRDQCVVSLLTDTLIHFALPLYQLYEAVVHDALHSHNRKQCVLAGLLHYALETLIAEEYIILVFLTVFLRAVVSHLILSVAAALLGLLFLQVFLQRAGQSLGDVFHVQLYYDQ
ncbi:hypothetical protein FGO68_gene6135 [Halteria grandinella]|uniref:Uncharacterized protein n=1 Tax=Halteria grandinella TaxID=5974 RepID=A0A8J8NUN6_HALGN|nr:hypothetical protein FGO68_gene6135 [Halteria grandinella]